MPPTILLIAPESAALPVADALRQDLHAEVEMTPSRRTGVASLRRNDFSLILIDESLATSDTASADLIYQNAGGALVVELNFAISSAARIVRQTRAALARRTQDHAQALAAATSTLHSELNSKLAGILLESELALREATPAQAPRLRHLVKLAGELRNHLRA
jgi:signal transduction histidine kinase